MVRTRHWAIVLLPLVVAVGVTIARQYRSAILYSVFPSITVTQKQKLSPSGEAALRAGVESGYLPELRWPDFRDHRPEVKKFYELSEYSLGWVQANKPTTQALSMITSLEGADGDGLQPEDYEGSRWRGTLRSLMSTQISEIDIVKFDLELTVSAMRYISDLHVGRVNPRQFDFGLDIETKRVDLAEFLHEGLTNDEGIALALRSLEPPFPAYWRTKSALQSYTRLARIYDQEPLLLPSAKGPVRPNDSYPGIARLASILTLLNDLPQDAPFQFKDEVYREPLVGAVKHFQQRHGLQADGVLNQKTLAELNRPLSQRVQQLQLTLERLRWLPHAFSQPPVVVNIPEFTLRALDDTFAPALISNVVVGKAYQHRTPVFLKDMKYVIFNPYWDVPASITRAELIPEIERNPRYLERHDYELVASGGRVVNTGTVGEQTLQQLRSGKLRIRQRPGSSNALGSVKFVFPNEHDVYLHDTPTQDLFSRPRRDLSHGCIRVEHAEKLACWVLRNQPGWTVDRIHEAMNATKTIQVNLAKPVPVLIVYGTAIALADGEVHFFDDIYGYDTALQRAIQSRYSAGSSGATNGARDRHRHEQTAKPDSIQRRRGGA